MDKQIALDKIGAALRAIKELRKAIDEDRSLIADAASQAPLSEVKSLLERMEAENSYG